jgi:hypothetical protein
MRKFFLFSLLAVATGAQAQTVSSFETLPLSSPDTFYVNYGDLGADVGFEDGLAYFPCVYDTAWGLELWMSGFAYSNMTDTINPAYTNMYSARPGSGYHSSNYAVVWEQRNVVHLRGAAVGKPVKGFYGTNSTYAYYSMRDGDGFTLPFSATNQDWAKITIRGFLNGQPTADSVEFYLADFRSADSADHYIVKDWRWVDLSSLGGVDSLEFLWSASDIGKPMYFCMDDFTTFENYEPLGASSVPVLAAKVYPNPATTQLFVERTGEDVTAVWLFDAGGRVVAQYPVTEKVTAIPTASLPAGSYILVLQGEGGTKASVRFQKQ